MTLYEQYVMFCVICYHLYNLNIVKNTHEKPATLLKVTLFPG